MRMCIRLIVWHSSDPRWRFTAIEYRQKSVPMADSKNMTLEIVWAVGSLLVYSVAHYISCFVAPLFKTTAWSLAFSCARIHFKTSIASHRERESKWQNTLCVRKRRKKNYVKSRKMVRLLCSSAGRINSERRWLCTSFYHSKMPKIQCEKWDKNEKLLAKSINPIFRFRWSRLFK